MTASPRLAPLDRNAATLGASAVRDQLGDRFGEADAAYLVDRLLSDLIPKHLTERRLLAAAYRLGVVRELWDWVGPNEPDGLKKALISRMTAEHYSEPGSGFAIEVWRSAVVAKPSAKSRPLAPRHRGMRRGRLLAATLVIGSLVAAAAALKPWTDATTTRALRVTSGRNASSEVVPPDEPLPKSTGDKLETFQLESSLRQVEESIEPNDTATPKSVLVLASREAPHSAEGELPTGPPQNVPPIRTETKPSISAGDDFRWLLLDDAKGDYEHPSFRFTLHRQGWVSFHAPSRSRFWLTSATRPRPLPDGSTWVPLSTERTVAYRNAKCHISRATRHEIVFAWFYDSGSRLWLVDAWNVTDRPATAAHGLFLYRESDDSWWSGPSQGDSSLGHAYSTRGLYPSAAAAAARRYVINHYLANGGSAYVNDFQQQQRRHVSATKPFR